MPWRVEAAKITQHLLKECHAMPFGRRGFADELHLLAILLFESANVAHMLVAIKLNGGDILLCHGGREYADTLLFLGDVIPDFVAKI